MALTVTKRRALRSLEGGTYEPDQLAHRCHAVEPKRIAAMRDSRSRIPLRVPMKVIRAPTTATAVAGFTHVVEQCSEP